MSPLWARWTTKNENRGEMVSDEINLSKKSRRTNAPADRTSRKNVDDRK